MTQLTFQDAVQELRAVYLIVSKDPGSDLVKTSYPVVPSLFGNDVERGNEPRTVHKNTLQAVGLELSKEDVGNSFIVSKRMTALQAYIEFFLSWNSTAEGIVYDKDRFMAFFEALESYSDPLN